MNSKDNIFSKFINMIKRIFTFNKALPEANEDVQSINVNQENTKDAFKNDLKFDTFEESEELLELQKKFQTNQIQLIDLTDQQLDDLCDLYDRQIEELKIKIAEKEQEILAKKKKLEAL